MLEHQLLRIRNYVRPDEPKACSRRIALADEAGMAESTIRQAGLPEWNPFFDTVSRLIAALERIEAREGASRDTGAAA